MIITNNMLDLFNYIKSFLLCFVAIFFLRLLSSTKYDNAFTNHTMYLKFTLYSLLNSKTCFG